MDDAQPDASVDMSPLDQLGSFVTGDAPFSDRRGAGATEEATFRYTRSPQDVLRLIAFAVTALVLTLLSIAIDDAILSFEEELVRAFDFLSPQAARIVDGAGQGLAITAGLLVYLVPLITRRYRVLGYAALASLSAFGLMWLLRELIDRDSSIVIINEIASRAGLDNSTVWSIQIAQTAALFTVVGPFVSRRWRRAGVVTLGVITLIGLLVSVELPVEAFLALPVGAMCGVAVLLVLGRPDRRPTLGAIAGALDNAGLTVSEVHVASVDARGSTPYFATLEDGSGLFVKVLGAQERAADLMFRVYRFLRLRDVGDDRPFSSLRRTVEHEALIALMARDIGIRTPRLRGVVDVGADSMLLAYDMVDGRSIDGLPDDEITDELMQGVWRQVGELRDHRIAHRDLRRANVFVDDTGTPWVIDFGFSEVAVDAGIRDADVAQLLASFVVVAGPERTVDAAVTALGPEVVGGALHRLQLQALSGATQSALKQQKGLLKALQDEVVRRCAVEQVEFDQLDRVNRKTIITIVVLALATYFLFPQFADLPGIIDQVQDANWAWTPLIVLTSMLTYAGATMSLGGAIPERLPAVPLFLSTIASSFASKLAPAGLGGMALSARFLQKQGVDKTVAASGIGLNTIAGFVGHISLIGIFVVWAGRDAFESFELPDPKYFIIGIGIVVASIGIGLLIPPVRKMITTRLFPILAKAFEGVESVLRRPGKVAMLLGGSMLITFFYLTTLFFAVEAFGGGVPFATVGAVFLVGSAVAQAAPTPGGLGAMEAALIGGLTAAGLDNTIAVPAVFMYRLFTFWLPILPGWLCFQWMQRNEYL